MWSVRCERAVTMETVELLTNHRWELNSVMVHDYELEINRSLELYFRGGTCTVHLCSSFLIFFSSGWWWRRRWWWWYLMGWCNPCPSLCVWGISLLVRDLQTHHGVERKGNGDGRTSWTIWSLQLDWFPVWVWDLQKWTFNGRLTWNGYSWEFKSLQCHWTFLSSPSCCCFPFFNIVNPVLIEVTPLTQRFLFLFSCRPFKILHSSLYALKSFTFHLTNLHIFRLLLLF